MNDDRERVILENTDGKFLLAHPKSKCEGEVCCLHKRTDHCMRSFPQHWRGDRGIMERICSHGVGHPDPDDWMNIDTIHGCCSPPCCGVVGETIDVGGLNWKVKYIKTPKLNDGSGDLFGKIVSELPPPYGWDTSIDPYEEIENLRNALTGALERETAKKVEIKKLQSEILQLKDSTNQQLDLRNVKGLSCSRCGGKIIHIHAWPQKSYICEACTREEVYEA